MIQSNLVILQRNCSTQTTLICETIQIDDKRIGLSIWHRNGGIIGTNTSVDTITGGAKIKCVAALTAKENIICGSSTDSTANQIPSDTTIDPGTGGGINLIIAITADHGNTWKQHSTIRNHSVIGRI